MNLYRIHYGWDRGGASSSDIEYFENEEPFKLTLLEVYLASQCQYSQSQYSAKPWFWPYCRAWKDKLFKSDDESNKSFANRLIKAEQVIDDQWVPVEHEFIVPDVILK